MCDCRATRARTVLLGVRRSSELDDWRKHDRVGVVDGVGRVGGLGSGFIRLHLRPESVGVGNVLDAAEDAVGVRVAIGACLDVVDVALLLVELLVAVLVYVVVGEDVRVGRLAGKKYMNLYVNTI